MGINDPSRERFEAALSLKKHDRVPIIEFIMDPVNLEILIERKPTKEQPVTLEEVRELSCRLGFDLLATGGTGPFYTFPEPSSEGRYKVGGLQSRDDVERTAGPDNIRDLIEGAKQTISFAAERDMGTYVFFFAPFTSVYCGMGIDRFWMTMYDDPELIEQAFDKANEYAMQVMAALSELDITMMLIADDVADNHGLLIQPNAFRDLWMPRMRKLVAPAIAKGIPIMVHTCGNGTDLLPLADELGITAIEPLQPTCNDIYQIKKDYGDRFCILGNIDIAGVLAFGTPEEVREDVRVHIDRLAGNGGYVVHSSHSIVDAIPRANFRAMVDEAKTYGRFG